MSNRKAGPRLAVYLLWLLLPRRAREVVVADLEEEYSDTILPVRGKAQSRRWYWRETFSLIKWYLKARFRGQTGHPHRADTSPDPVSAGTPRAPARGFLESVIQDLRIGLRSLRRRPTFTVAAVLTLGLGIGATTTMFSVVNGVLLSGLKFEDAGELVTIWETFPEWRGKEIVGASWDRNFLSYPEYENVRAGTTVFKEVAVYGDAEKVLTGAGEPLELTVGNATASFAGALGVRPILGRWFLPGEDGATAQQLAVLSYSMWRDRFGGDPSIIGSSVVLNDLSYNVIGVLPPAFRFRMLLNRSASDPGDRGIWVPTGSPGVQIHQGNHSYEGVARLRAGVTLEHARLETEALVRRNRPPSEVGIRLLPRLQAETGGVRSPLALLFGATIVLLGIACGNVATLLLGEHAHRRSEMATRTALGAGVWRISRQLLVESLLLGILGAALGALLAFVGTELLLTLGPPIPRLDNVAVDGPVLVFATIAGVIAGLLFGLFPALTLIRGSSDLRGNIAPSVMKVGSRRFEGAVVAMEIALTVVLLVGGGLLVRSLSSLLAVDPGFDADDIAVARVSVSEERYPSGEERVAVYKQVAERIDALPTVTRVSGTHRLPFLDRPSGNTIRLERWEPGQHALARIATVLPDFFEALGIPLLAGRTFTPSDNADSPDVMIVNESMARRFWPDETPVGTRVRWYERTWTVVGVVGDVRHSGLDVEVESTFYVPHRQTGYPQMTLVARSDGNVGGVLSGIREAVWSVDPDLPVTVAGSLDALISRSAAEERYRTMLLTLFGVIAAVLAAVGVFGTTARGVASRTRELGIRFALGARRSNLVKMMMHSTLVVGLVGVSLGLIVASWASRLLSGFLFGIETRDPLTFLSVTVLLLIVCILASYLPARRATRVDPAEVLRME